MHQEQIPSDDVRRPGVLRRAVTAPVRWTLMPYLRAADSVRSSFDRLRQDVAQVAATHQTQGDLASAERDERQRFEDLAAIGGWTEDALRTQLKAVKRSKIAALMLIVVGLVAGLGSVFVANWLVGLVVLASGVLLCLRGVSGALRMGHYQAQLEERSLLSLRSYLGRQDLFSHLLS